MAVKNIEKWYSNFNVLKKFVEEYHKLPTATDTYNDIKIGSWLQNQRSDLKRGKLSEELLQSLNSITPYWCGTQIEIKEQNKKFLIESNWKSKVPEGHTPIDTMFTGDKLYEYLVRDIFDIETLLSSENRLNIREYYDCLAKVIPIIHPRYAMLLRVICGEHAVAPLNEMKEFFYSFCVSSREEMQDKMNKMLLEGLTERESKVLTLRFALIDIVEHNMYLEETGRIIGVSRNRIRQIEAKALRKLRNPARMNIIRKAGNILDAFDQNTRADLYRRGIKSKEDILKLVEDETISTRLKLAIEEFIEKDKEREAEEERQIKIEEILDKEIDFLELSVRSYNSLKRSGHNTVRDVVKTYQDKEKFAKIRNFGIRSMEEVENKLKVLGVSDTVIEDKEIEEEKPKSSITIPKQSSIEDAFDMNAIDKDLKIESAINQIIIKLYDVLSGKYSNDTIQYIEESCKYIYLNDNTLNSNAALSNLVSCAMIFVRDPSVVTNTNSLIIKMWISNAIVMYQYINNKKITDSFGDWFSLKKAFLYSFYCHWKTRELISSSAFTNIMKNVKNGIYEGDYLIQCNGLHFRQRINKIFNTERMFFIYAYNFLKDNGGSIKALQNQFPNISEIDKLINSVNYSTLSYLLKFFDSVIDFYRVRISPNRVTELENQLYKILLTKCINIEDVINKLPFQYATLVKNFIQHEENKENTEHHFKTGDKVNILQMNGTYLNLIVAYEEEDGKHYMCIDPFKESETNKCYSICINEKQLFIGWR